MRRRPPSAAPAAVLVSNGHPSLARNLRTAMWPLAAAARETRSSHGAPSFLAYLRTSRCPPGGVQSVVRQSRYSSVQFSPRKGGQEGRRPRVSFEFVLTVWREVYRCVRFAGRGTLR